MNSQKKYDITIIGSGLCAYTALIYLLKKKIHLKKKICIISGENKSKKIVLNKSELSYLSKFHKVIFKEKNYHEIDKKFLDYSIKGSHNLIYLKNLGGLSKYWGGGFFPEENLNLFKNNKIKNFIIDNFSMVKYSKINFFNIKNIKKKFVKEIDPQFLTCPENNKELLNPGLEIEKLCKTNNLKLIRGILVEDISQIDSGGFYINSTNNKIKTNYILLSAGIIGSPRILFKSNILTDRKVTIKDHLLYRIPLIRLSSIVSLFCPRRSLQYKKVFFISSLKQAFIFNVVKRNLFLGLYTLNPKKIKVNGILEFLIKNQILIFSQIYVGRGLGEYKLEISLDLKKKKNIKNKFTSLCFKEWKEIFLFFLKNKIVPIPFKYKTQFGSSYHMYGSLANKINKFNFSKNHINKIFVIDASSLKKIDSEPTSSRMIENTIKRVDKFLNLLENN